MSDISEVAPGLYIASRFYPLEGEIPRYCVPIDCAAALRDDDTDQSGAIGMLAHVIQARILPWGEYGLNVLLICDAGRNRSAVVAARVLMLQGSSAEEAIDRVRKAREPVLGRSGGALTNQAFVAYLERQEASQPA